MATNTSGGRRGGGVAQYTCDCFDCVEATADSDECLWVGIRRRPINTYGEVGIDHLARVKTQIKYCLGIQEKSLLLSRTSVSLMSAGNTTEQRGSSVRGSKSVWAVTS